MKVLLLYAKVGNGHLKAAESIKAALQDLDETIEALYEDDLAVGLSLRKRK